MFGSFVFKSAANGEYFDIIALYIETFEQLACTQVYRLVILCDQSIIASLLYLCQ